MLLGHSDCNWLSRQIPNTPVGGRNDLYQSEGRQSVACFVVDTIGMAALQRGCAQPSDGPGKARAVPIPMILQAGTSPADSNSPTLPSDFEYLGVSGAGIQCSIGLSLHFFSHNVGGKGFSGTIFPRWLAVAKLLDFAEFQCRVSLGSSRASLAFYTSNFSFV